MTDSKIETVKTIYEAFGRGDVETILSHLTDDVDWAAEAEGDAAPWYGNHRGIAEVPRFFKELGAAAEVTEFTPLSFASNDTDVMVVIRFAMTSTATGRSGASNIHHWWRFRDGKVCQYRGTEDTALTAGLLAGD